MDESIQYTRIFALRSFSSGLRFLLVICFPSCLMSLFYTLLWRFTQNLGRSLETLDELKEKEPDTYNFILNLQNGTNEWRDYR